MVNAIRTWLDARLQPAYLRLVAGAIVVVGMVLAIFSYATAKQGTTAVGIPWGADFAGFYVAAQILDQGDASRLYDRQLHAQMYHHLLPGLPADEIIPYVHPPFVAGTLRLLTRLPYDIAVALWMIVSLAFYAGGVLLILKTCPILDRTQRWLVLLLALSFEPFLFECWLGGQLSAVAFFSYALAWYCFQRGKPIVAGLTLGICFYKPTLLILVLPVLLLSQQWMVLAGMSITGVLLVLTSLAMVGWDCTISYLDVLLAFRQSTAGHDGIAIRTWKYVDFNHFFELMVKGSVFKPIALVGVVLACLGRLVVPRWWQWGNKPPTRTETWAMTLFLVPLINLYVGIYDSILVVQGAILMTELILQRTNCQPGGLQKSGWPLLLVLLAVTPWFSSYVARYGGVQVYTVVILLCAVMVANSEEQQHACAAQDTCDNPVQ